MQYIIEINDVFRDNNHGIRCKVVDIDPDRFHKYLLISENGDEFWESKQALLSNRYTYVQP